MKVYVLFAEGFEVLEAMAPVDVLKRCGANVMTVSVNEDILVKTSQNNIFKADVLLKDIDYKDGDVLIIPGGYPGYVNLRENDKVVEIVKYYLEKDKYIAAICGGPTIFSYNKLACGKTMTGHSSIASELRENHNYVDKAVNVDGKIITGVGAGHSIDFAFAIAEQLFDKEVVKNAKVGMELC